METGMSPVTRKMLLAMGLLLLLYGVVSIAVLAYVVWQFGLPILWDVGPFLLILWGTIVLGEAIIYDLYRQKRQVKKKDSSASLEEM